jgi:hypothetical protein
MALNRVSNAGPLMVFSKLIAPLYRKIRYFSWMKSVVGIMPRQKNLHCFDSVYLGKEVL